MTATPMMMMHRQRLYVQGSTAITSTILLHTHHGLTPLILPTNMLKCQEFVTKIKELEGGTILLNRNGKSPSWRSQTRLNQEGPPDVSWDSARQHWSRKATFYSAIENPATGNEYIEKLQALIVEKGRHAHVNGNVVASAFRAFADSMPKKRKAAPAAPV